MKFKEHEHRATVSVGVALAPADGNDPERLLKSADLALYKSQGRRPQLHPLLPARRWMPSCLRESSSKRPSATRCCMMRFKLHYQPLFEISNRRLIGFEALIRLPAEDGTLIPPLVFIPVAEDLRLIDKIGAWVLREACRTAATWPEHLTVAVNLSPAQFDGRQHQQHRRGRAKGGRPRARIGSSWRSPRPCCSATAKPSWPSCKALKAMGVAIVMDDFGTGYSSLSYLWRFPFDKIKIDRSFMQGFDGSGRDAETVVKTIIALGRELHMRVTVEGVETAKQAAFLDGVDGDQAQGFFFGRPVPASEVSATILADFQKALPMPMAAPAQEVRRHLVKLSG